MAFDQSGESVPDIYCTHFELELGQEAGRKCLRASWNNNCLLSRFEKFSLQGVHSKYFVLHLNFVVVPWARNLGPPGRRLGDISTSDWTMLLATSLASRSSHPLAHLSANVSSVRSVLPMFPSIKNFTSFPNPHWTYLIHKLRVSYVPLNCARFSFYSASCDQGCDFAYLTCIWNQISQITKITNRYKRHKVYVGYQHSKITS